MKELKDKAECEKCYSGHDKCKCVTTDFWIKESYVKEAFEKMMPTDEEIDEQSKNADSPQFRNGFEYGAKWLRDNLKDKMT